MKKLDQDIVVGIVILLFTSVLASQVGKIRGTGTMLPILLLCIMAVSGFGIIVNAIWAMKKTGVPYTRINLKEFFWEAGIPGSILIVNVLLLKILGFYICSFLLIVEICIIQGYLIKGMVRPPVKSVVKISLFAFLTTVFLYIFFNIILSLPTPKGIFGI